MGSIANEIEYYKDERNMGKQEKKLVVKNAIKGDPEGTVKTYLSRAKKELKDILKEGYLNE